MFRAVRVVVSLLLLGLFLPGTEEVVENTGHLLRHGHLAHARPDGDTHGDPPVEHGCTGTLHLCSCCTSVSFLLATATELSTEPASEPLFIPANRRVRSFLRSGIDHPPRA